MYLIAVVEDNEKERKILCRYIERYFEEEKEDFFRIIEFDNAEDFLKAYQANYDIIFLDIQMPGINGMDAAEKLREMDQWVPVIFVTSMAQFAVRGYDVNALGFLVKPVGYYNFYLRMRKAINVTGKRTNHTVAVNTKQGIKRIRIIDILYLEVRGHTLSYHLGEEIVEVQGSMTKAEKELSAYNFMRCNSCYLVNPKAISKISGYTICLLNGEELQISHPKKKAFMQQMNQWIGEGEKI